MTATRNVAVGPTGPQGPPGAGANWRGVWSSGTTYAVGDGVYRNGLPFISNVAGNLNHDPSTDTGTNWGVVTSRNAAPDLVVNAKAEFSALGNGRYVTDAAITTGTATLSSTSAAFTSADIGKHVLVNGAAGAGVPLHSTISSVAAGVATLAANASATVSSATCVYGTDDTAAIQAAIDYIANNGGGRVVIPDGVYILAGALKTAATSGNATGGLSYNSQLTIPAMNPSGTAASHMALELQGGQGPPYPSYGAAIQQPGTILQSMLTSVSGSSYPSILGGPLSASWVSLAFTSVFVRMRNITVRAPQNPFISGVNFQKVNNCDVSSLNVDTTEVDVAVGGTGLTQPTHPTAVGFLMPTNFVNDYCHAYAVSVRGFYGGIAWGEYSYLEQCQAWECYVGFVPTPAFHSAHLSWCFTLHCPYHVAYVDPSTGVGAIPATSHGSRVIWETWDIEHGAHGSSWDSWTDAICHIYDPTNQLSGRISKIHAVKTGGSGDVLPLTVVGATRVAMDYLAPLADTGSGKFSRYGDLLYKGGSPRVGMLSGSQVYGGGAVFSTDVLGKGSLVSYWRQNDATGSSTMVDANGAAHNGAYQGSVGLVGPANGPLGDANSGFAAYNGVTYATVPQHAALSPASALTVLALVYVPTIDPLATTRVLFGNYNHSSPAGYAVLLFDGNVYFKLGATDIVSTSYQVPFGQWVLIGATYAASTANVYANGNLVKTAAAPATLSYTGATIGVAAYGDGTSPFAGQLAEIALLNTALTAAEMQTLYLDSVAASLSMFGGIGSVKPQITGSKGANAALTSLLAALAQMGLVFDNST